MRSSIGRRFGTIGPIVVGAIGLSLALAAASQESPTRGASPPAPPGTGRGNMPAFSDFDQDKDGKITEQEFNDVMAERIRERAEAGRKLRGMADGHSFADLDANHDGAISREEFAAHQDARRKGSGGSR